MSHVDTHNGTVVKPFCPRTLAYYIYINARSHHSICVKLYSSLNMNIWYVCERQPHSVTPQKFTSMNKLLTKHRRFSTSTHPTEPHDILFPRTSWNSFKDLTPTSHVYTGTTWRTNHVYIIIPINITLIHWSIMVRQNDCDGAISTISHDSLPIPMNITDTE